MRRNARRILAVAAVGTCLAASAAVATDGLPTGAEPVTLDPAAMSTDITNPYLPMRPGTRWVYVSTQPDGPPERDVVVVTDETRRLANGVTARVVRDTVTVKGVPQEVTDDYYAQDRAGNVWYLGEQTTEYRAGKPVSTEGSFEAGKDGAQAGIAMPAQPRVGMRYRQEYLRGEAEDAASVLRVGEQAQTRLRYFPRVVVTRDTNRLKPREVEYKFYARGVGLVMALGVSVSASREELVRFTPGR